MSEHTEQCALFDWVKWNAGRLPELDLLFAIPNGAAFEHRTDKRGNRYSPEGQRMRAAGLREGVPDLCLPVARQGKHSLYIELKDGKNRTTNMQERWLHDLRGQGMACHVCYGWMEAARVIVGYLSKIPEEYGL